MKGMKRATIYFVLSAVVFLVGGGFAFMLFGSLGDKTSEIAKLKSEARHPDELQADLDSAKATWQDNGIKLAHLEKGIPEVAYVPTMLKELEAFGKQSGVQVFGVRPYIAATPASKKDKKKQLDKPYTELSIEIKGKGKYRNVMNFVKAMTGFPKIVAVRTVALTPKNDPNVDRALLDVTIELRAFLFKPAQGEETAFPIEQPKTSEVPTEPRQGIPSSTPPKAADGKPAATASNPGGNS